MSVADPLGWPASARPAGESDRSHVEHSGPIRTSSAPGSDRNRPRRRTGSWVCRAVNRTPDNSPDSFDGRAVGIAQQQRHGKGEIAAYRIATKQNAASVHVPFRAMHGQMTNDSCAFFQCAWELCFRRERIIHTHHSHVPSSRVFAGQPVVGVDRGLNPPAAVKVDHHGQSFIDTRAIEPAENTPSTRDNPTIGRLGHHRAADGGFNSYGIERPTMWFIRQFHSDGRVVRKLLADVPEEGGQLGIYS